MKLGNDKGEQNLFGFTASTERTSNEWLTSDMALYAGSPVEKGFKNGR